MLKKILPGVIVMIMTLVWVLPFFVLNLSIYPLSDYSKSYRLYYLVFSSTLLIGIAAIIVNHFVEIWDRAGYWVKFLFVWGAYFINIGLILVVFSTTEPGTWEFFGGCPAGSFGMLFIPTVIVYFICGMFAGLIYTMDRRAKEQLKK